MPGTVQKASRSVSPILLVLAALCFLLPFIGVSCSGSPAQALGSLPGVPNPDAQTSSCLSAISNTDLYTYSGLNLATGSAPSTASIPPSCSSAAGGNTAASQTPTVGVQPLLVVVLVLIIVGIVATALRTQLRAVVAGGAALVAAILVIADNAAAHDAIRDRINALANQSSGSPNLGLQALGGVGGFFNVHAAIGFTLILVALFAAVGVNAVGLIAGSGLRLTPTAGGGPPPADPPAWRADPPPAPPPASG
jgi:hypothetical protein